MNSFGKYPEKKSLIDYGHMHHYRPHQSICAVEGAMTGDADSAVASDAVCLPIVGDWRRFDGQPLPLKAAAAGRLKEG